MRRRRRLSKQVRHSIWTQGGDPETAKAVVEVTTLTPDHVRVDLASSPGAESVAVESSDPAVIAWELKRHEMMHYLAVD